MPVLVPQLAGTVLWPPAPGRPAWLRRRPLGRQEAPRRHFSPRRPPGAQPMPSSRPRFAPRSRPYLLSNSPAAPRERQEASSSRTESSMAGGAPQRREPAAAEGTAVLEAGRGAEGATAAARPGCAARAPEQR